MESVLLLVNDKKGFLHAFIEGNFEISPLVIGMVFSFSQKELKDDLVLFRALDRLISSLQDEMQIFYCVFKMIKSGEDYLKAQYSRKEFLEVYCKVTSMLSGLRVPRHLESKINFMFTENWKKLVVVFASSEAFGSVYWLGKQCARIFSKIPMMLSNEIDKEMEVILEFQRTLINKEFLTSLNGVLRFLKFYENTEDCVHFASFLVVVISYVFRNNSNLEVLNELKKKTEDFSQVFSEQSKIEMNIEYKKAICRLSGQTLNPVSSEIANRPQHNSWGFGGIQAVPENPSGDSWGFGGIQAVPEKPSSNLIKIPKKEYSNESSGALNNHNAKPPQRQFRPPGASFFNREDSAPPEINLNNSDSERSLNEIVEMLKEEHKTSQNLDAESVRSLLESCADKSVTFPIDLKKTLKRKIENNYSEFSLDLMEVILEGCKNILLPEDIAEIAGLLEEKDKRAYNEGVLIRGNSQFRRPRSRGTMSRDQRRFGSDYHDNGRIQDESSFQSKESEENSDYKVEWSSNPSNDSSFSAKSVPIEKSLQTMPEEKVVPRMEDHQYFELINSQSLEFIKCIRAEFNEIAEYNKILVEIKSQLKEKSPSCLMNLIGSISMSTHIKNTVVDTSYIDFLCPNPLKLLKDTILSLNCEVLLESDSLIVFKKYETTYKVYINLELYCETTGILRECVTKGTVFQDLVILLKYWVLINGLNQGFLSGYHLTLICLNYLLRFEPPVMPKLQQGDSDQQFNQNLGSSNILGFAFCNLFSFLNSIYGRFAIDPTDGNLIPGELTHLFSCFNLINRNEISNLPLTDPRTKQFCDLIQKTMIDINDQKDLYKIMRLK